MTRVRNDGFVPDRTTQIGLANTKWEKKYLTGQPGLSAQTLAKHSSASSLVDWKTRVSIKLKGVALRLEKYFANKVQVLFFHNSMNEVLLSNSLSLYSIRFRIGLKSFTAFQLPRQGSQRDFDQTIEKVFDHF